VIVVAHAHRGMYVLVYFRWLGSKMRKKLDMLFLPTSTESNINAKTSVTNFSKLHHMTQTYFFYIFVNTYISET